MSGYNTVLARNTENAPESALSTQSVAFSHYNHLSAQLPLDPKTGKMVAGGVKEQAEQCLENMKAIVESVAHVMDDVVAVTVFLKDSADMAAVDEVYTTFFQNGVPARTTLAVSALPMDALVQMEALVSNGEGTIPNAPQAGDLVKVTNNTSHAPVSPLSAQSVAFSHYNHLSAQLPLDPATGKMVAGGVKEQAEQCLKNMKAIVESVAHVMDDVVAVTVLLKDSADMAAVDEVYTTFFQNGVPARTTLAVSALPMDALVQIDAVVSNAEGTPPVA